MNYLPLIVIILLLLSCKKEKNKPINTPPPDTTASFKTIGSDYVTNAYVYPKFTTDNNMLAILMKSTNACDLVKINPSGNIVWATALGTSLFYNNAIKELNNDTYMIYSSNKVFVVNKNGVIIKEHPLFIMDGHKNGSDIYLVNMDYCYKLDMNYNLVDSFPNLHKPSSIGLYYGNGNGNIRLTTHSALFRNDHKIQYFYQDSTNAYIMKILTCNLDNVLVDSTQAPAGRGFFTFKSSGNHIIIGKGLWGGLGAPSFFVRLFKYINGSSMEDFSHFDYTTYYFNGKLSESSDNNIVFVYQVSHPTFTLYKSNTTQTNLSESSIAADSIIKLNIVRSSDNIGGVVCEPGTDNFYLLTVGTPLGATWAVKPQPQIIKVNGTPEVINF